MAALVGNVTGDDAAGNGTIIGQHTAAVAAVSRGSTLNRVAGDHTAGHVQEGLRTHKDAAALGTTVVTGNRTARKVQGAVSTVQLHTALTAGDLTGVVATGVLDGENTALGLIAAKVYVHTNRTSGTTCTTRTGRTGNGMTIQIQRDIQCCSGVLQVFVETGSVIQQRNNIGTTIGVIAGCKAVKCLLQSIVVCSYAIMGNLNCATCRGCRFGFRLSQLTGIGCLSLGSEALHEDGRKDHGCAEQQRKQFVDSFHRFSLLNEN